MILRLTQIEDAAAVAALQPLAFPPPFDPAYHWRARHFECHVRNFPAGQFVVVHDERIVASSSNVLLGEESRSKHLETGSHPYDVGFATPPDDPTTLYGADIAVHPAYRRRGIARMIYRARFDLVRELDLLRYGTACRMPDFTVQGEGRTSREYADAVVEGTLSDRTLTPLVKMGLTLLNVVPSTWPDVESGGFSAVLEWRP